MKSRKYRFLLTVLMCLLLTGCDIMLSPGPTGTPEGTIGHAMVFAGGRVYVQDIYDETFHYPDIPYGYTLYGTVKSASDNTIPEVEFHAALVDVGSELYLSETEGNYLFVRTDNGTESGSIRRYLRLNDSPLSEVYADFDGT